MTDHKHIAALIKAQQEMGKLTKNSTNPHFKSKYADLTAVLETCTDALHTNGFAILQPSGKDEGGMFTDTTLMHESGGAFTTRVYWVGVKSDMQGSGSAMTYARRYGLMALTGLAPEDDDGAEASKKPRQEQKRDTDNEKRDAPAPRDAAKIRDGLKAAIAKAKTTAELTAAEEGGKFKEAFDWLKANDEPKANEVTKAFVDRWTAIEADAVPFS